MKKYKILLFALSFITISSISFMLGARANISNEQISAILNRTIKITYNSQTQTFKDEKGGVVYPISYNGTTYLPARAVSEMLDISVEWDAVNNTVLLGENNNTSSSLVHRTNSGDTDKSWVITNSSELSFGTNKKYDAGLAYNISNGMFSDTKTQRVYFDVEGKTEISFTAANSSNTQKIEIRLYDQDDKAISTVTLNPGQTIQKTIKLTDISEIAFGAKTTATYSGADFNAYIYEPTLK